MRLNKISVFVLLIVFVICFSCKKDLYQADVQTSENSITLISNIAQGQSVILSSATDSVAALLLKWTDPGYFTDTAKGNVIVNYILDMDTSSTFTNAKSYNMGTGILADTLSGLDLNNKILSIGADAGVAQKVYVRVRSVFSVDTIVSNVVSFTATPYSLPLPALLVIGENGWTTPTTRTNGYILTSAKKDNKYEGYINFSYASYGGTNCRLLSTLDNSAYGWGTDAYTIQQFADLADAWNLWITPCPNYMKVDVDIDAMTINYTPIQFYICGSFNNWGNTPMTFDPATNEWTASNITFADGDTFVFITGTWNASSSSWGTPSYDICYKTDETGKLIFAGNPVWGGNNIPVAKAGIYTVTLDLSGGDGNYTYSME